ncbi:MAG: FimB/Mfa2 family fimbrial subunit [Prevotella sp.]|nr:FimB/Mfa2 family fimbrial subunit [Prevotella sp.]
MKKLMFWGACCALVALCVFVSCEKPLSSDETTGSVKGNLIVRVFQIEKTPFASLFPSGGRTATRGVEPVSQVCTRLNYAVYDQDGTRVKQVNQTSDMSNYGTASFQLEEGDYTLVVVGHSSGGNPTMTNLAKIQFTNGTGYSDTFLSSGAVSIGDEPVEMQVSLNRIVSLCRFVVTDDIPAGVAKMQFYYTGGSGAFNATTGLGSVNSKQTVTYDVTDGQKQFDLYTFLHDVTGTITLKVTARDVNDNELYRREFAVPMEVNHITWLSGAFFSGSSASSATAITGLTVNTDWSGETHLTF